MLYVAAERSYVAGIGVPHFGDCVSALVGAGSQAGGAGGETGGDGSGVRAEGYGKRKREEERKGEEREMHIRLEVSMLLEPSSFSLFTRVSRKFRGPLI